MNADAYADLLNGQAGWLSVRASPSVPGPGWISCEAMVSAQLAGADPTGWWREKLETAYGAQYQIDPPRQVAAMFVLMWYIGVPLYVATVASALTGTSPDVSPGGLAFRLHPTQHYPEEIALLPGPELAMKEAAAAVLEHCRTFVDSYAPGAKLGTRQRYGAIADDIRGHLVEATARGAPFAAEAVRAFGADPTVTVRDSCCYIYALPGVTACSTCPRLR